MTERSFTSRGNGSAHDWDGLAPIKGSSVLYLRERNMCPDTNKRLCFRRYILGLDVIWRPIMVQKVNKNPTQSQWSELYNNALKNTSYAALINPHFQKTQMN